FGRKRGGARDPHAGTAHHFEDQAEPAGFAFRAVEPAAQKAARVIDPFFGGAGGVRELSFREHRRVFAYFVGDNYPMPRGKTCERFGARTIIPTPPLARCYRAQRLNFFSAALGRTCSVVTPIEPSARAAAAARKFHSYQCVRDGRRPRYVATRPLYSESRSAWGNRGKALTISGTAFGDRPNR